MQVAWLTLLLQQALIVFTFLVWLVFIYSTTQAVLVQGDHNVRPRGKAFRKKQPWDLAILVAMGRSRQEQGCPRFWLVGLNRCRCCPWSQGKGRDMWARYVSGSTGHRRHTWRRGHGGLEDRSQGGVQKARGKQSWMGRQRSWE